jgi:hypothetical protein
MTPAFQLAIPFTLKTGKKIVLTEKEKAELKIHPSLKMFFIASRWLHYSGRRQKNVHRK